MITIAKIQGNVDYYIAGERSDADRAAGYYLDGASGEPPAFWSGAGAEALSLSGQIDEAEFAALFTTHADPRDPKFADPATRGEAALLGSKLPTYRSTGDLLAAKLAAYPGTPTPEDQARLLVAAEKETRRALLGYDLTFSPPKDFTLLLMAAGYAEQAARDSGNVEEMNRWAARRTDLTQAALDANKVALEYAAEQAAYSRQQVAGTQLIVKGKGFVHASFEQHDNRAGAPSFHVHNPTLNKIENEDGKWRTPEGPGIVAARPAVSAVADRALRERVEELGYSTVARAEARTWAVEGITDEVRESVSERSQEVNAKTQELLDLYAERYGREATAREASKLHRAANKQTRAAKVKGGQSTADLIERTHEAVQREMAGGLEALAARHRDISPPAVGSETAWSRRAVIAQALDAVQAADATWTRWDLTQRLEELLPPLALATEDVPKLLHELTTEALHQGYEPIAKISGGIHAPDAPTQLRRADGALVYETPTQHRYALRSHLDKEASLQAAAVIRDRAAVEPEAARKALAAYADGQDPGYRLSVDQQAVAGQLLTGGARLATVIGPAGTGKSTTIGAVSQVWPEVSSGGRVVGVAVSEKAAMALRDAGVPHVLNAARFEATQVRLAEGRDWTDDGPYRLQANDKLVIDEASMMTTQLWDRLMQMADRSATAVVATGDPFQMGAVGAGGVMADIAADPTAEVMTLRQVHRFAEPWEGEASLRLRDGDQDVVREYARHGRLYAAGDAAGMQQQAAEMYVAARAAGKTAAVMAETNATANTISALIRDQLVDLGLVADGPVVELGRDGNVGGVGDVIACRHPDRALGLVNREKLEVLALGEDGSMDAVTKSGAVKHIPADYVSQHVSLGYAATIHGEQGGTVDVGITAVTKDSSRSALYTGATRGRERNVVVAQTVYPDKLRGQEKLDERVEPMRPEAVLAAVLDGDGPEQSATAQAAEHAEHRASWGTVGGEHEHAMEVACRERTDRALDRLAADGRMTEADRARFAADSATGQLSRMLRSAEQAGHDSEKVLVDALAAGSLKGAKSVGQVMCARVDKLGLPMEPQPGHVPVAGIGGEWAAHLVAQHEHAAAREAELGERVAEAAPAWAVTAFGPVPEEPSARGDWVAAAGRTERARERLGWEDEQRPLGPSPSTLQPEARAEWFGAWNQLGRPEAVAEEGGMSEGRLRARIEAAERVEREAPAHLDRQAGATWQAADVAGRDAALAEARGDQAAADAAAEDAVRLEQRARLLEPAVIARDEHVEEVRSLMETRRRAEEELLARGIDLAVEEKATAQEHLDELLPQDPEEVLETDIDLVSEKDRAELAADLAAEMADLSPEVHIPAQLERPEPVGEVVSAEFALEAAEFAATWQRDHDYRVAQVAEFEASHALVPESQVRRRDQEATEGMQQTQ